MEKIEINGQISPSSSMSNGRTVKSLSSTPVQPNFSSRSVQEALERLASVDLSELFNEAKIENCRATRDLRSCGRYVQYALNSCGHASLCGECSQRCDICPICRTPLAKSGNDRIHLRLYDECMETGLISRRCDERFQDKEDRDNQLTVDVQRLYSFFDVALENNLVSLVCHYVTDICMDETAVSSDAVTALLLDEKVVKDWVKQAFKNIVTELQGIYCLEVRDMENSLSSLLKFSVRLAGLSSVLEVLDSSIKGRLSAQLHDLHHIQESILKTLQHLEITIWCIRYNFLVYLKARHATYTSWRNLVRERKEAAVKRSWPDVVDHSANSAGQAGSLFIEDALANLEIEQANDQEIGEESGFAFLQKNGALLYFRSKIEGMAGCYPFENLQAAVDILFLHCSSDLVVAKQAIFLYYLFDRHWTMPEEQWRHIVDDFAASFGITRNSLLESFTFCLLDDHSDEALQKCQTFLPEICGPTTHPKIAQVLLERQNPEAAQMVLRWSGRDGGSKLVPLNEAVTIVRVKVECGLLTEAFTYQRMLCSKVHEKKLKYGPSADSLDDLNDQFQSWMDWIEVLVTEICCLCIRSGLVDRMIGLPWNSDEEKHVHKCLLEYATDDPSTTIGSLLVVFYLQRYRYVEAYKVDLKLRSLEDDFMSSVNEEVVNRVESQRQRRKKLVDKGIELLPEVLQHQVRTGTLSDIDKDTVQEDEMSARSGLAELQQLESASLLVPSTFDSNNQRPDQMATSRPQLFENPKTLGGYVTNSHVEVGNDGSSSILRGRLFADPERVSSFQVGKSLKFDDISSPRVRRTSPTYATTPSKGISWNSSKELSNRHLQEKHSDIIISEGEQNGFLHQIRNRSPPYSRRVTANPTSTPSSNHGLFKGSANNLQSNISGKRGQSDRDDRHCIVPLTEELLSWSCSHGERPFEDGSGNAGLRWRSDEASDEEEPSPEVTATPLRGSRRRFVRR